MKFPKQAIYAVIVLAALGVAFPWSQMQNSEENNGLTPVTILSYSHFLDMVHHHDIQKATVSATYGGQIVVGVDGSGQVYESRAPENSPISDTMVSDGVAVTELPPTLADVNWKTEILGMLVRAGIMISVMLIMVLIFRLASRKGGLMSMGKSPAKLYRPGTNDIRFSDVAGIDEIRSELQEVVDFLKDPTRYKKLGAEMPRGFLLEGPPGVGKTLAARAIAGEAAVPFFSVGASDFVEVFVGVGASRIRSMIAAARKCAPCIVFIDEIDAVGKARGSVGGNDERENTINALLSAMDGFDDNRGIIFLAATNRIADLDEALTRPGRFDRKVTFSLPGLDGRKDILRVHIHKRKSPFEKGLDINAIARRTAGFSGADLSNLVNQACLQAARRHGSTVTLKDFEVAQDRIVMGLESLSQRSSLTHEELLRTARHEVGHALVASLSPNCHPVHRISIIPRGSSLGMVVTLPDRERMNATLPQINDELATIMAGRAAEILIYGRNDISAGAASDIQAATLKARAMVMNWGMGSKTPLMTMLTGATTSVLSVSTATARSIDLEVGTILDAALERALSSLSQHRRAFDEAVNALMEAEEMTGDEFRDVIASVIEEDRAPRAQPALSPTSLPQQGLGLDAGGSDEVS